MNFRLVTVGTLFSFVLFSSIGVGAASPDHPAPPRNIVYILADDFGYGDLGCYGATKIKTPNLDRLAAEGMRFTDAYAPSSVCSPSRYAIMTGRFFWRTTNDCEVLNNDAPFHAGLERTTIASLLKKAGYTTGCVGKWHLGMGSAPKADWNAPLKPGPNEAGFDYFFGMSSNLMPPDIYIENHGIAGQTPGTKITITGRGPNLVATGVTEPRLDIEAGPRFNAKAIEFIEKSKNAPFFLFYTPNEVHDPIVPTPQFQGSSQAGPYGDFIQQLDFEVGKILDTLDRLGLAKDTLVIFTSDNGGVVPKLDKPGKQIDQAQAIKMGLAINGPLRGGKHSDFEGGFRIPFIARWPGQIPAGVVSPAIINTTDFLATAAALTHQAIPPADAEDSFNILPVLLNKTTVTKGRDYTVSLSARGNYGVRSDEWKYIEKRIDANFSANIIKTHMAEENQFQLYNLKLDLGETKNLYAQNPAVDAKLQADLDACRNNQRSHEEWSVDLQDNPNN